MVTNSNSNYDSRISTLEQKVETLERTNIRISITLDNIQEELKHLRSIDSRLSRIEGILHMQEKQSAFFWDIFKVALGIATGATALQVYKNLF